MLFSDTGLQTVGGRGEAEASKGRNQGERGPVEGHKTEQSCKDHSQGKGEASSKVS